jgi:putative membrane protein
MTDEQRLRVRERVAAFEHATGVELVTALLPRCDDYPEIPWKAFAFGAAAATLVLLLAAALPGFGIDSRPQWSGGLPLAPLASALAAGLVLAAAAAFVGPVARLFLSGTRAEAEARQAAQVLFLEHELFGTAGRTGVLLLVAQFERRVVLVADRGLRERLPPGVLDEVVAVVTAGLGRGSLEAAFAAGIDRLEALVRELGLAGGPAANVLPDALDPAAGRGA